MILPRCVYCILEDCEVVTAALYFFFYTHFIAVFFFPPILGIMYATFFCLYIVPFYLFFLSFILLIFLSFSLLIFLSFFLSYSLSFLLTHFFSFLLTDFLSFSLSYFFLYLILYRHFEQLFSLIKVIYYPGMQFSLDFLLSNGILGHKDSVAELSSTASGEARLEDSLEKIKSVRSILERGSGG